MRWRSRIVLCLALCATALSANDAPATNLFARRYGLDQFHRPWYSPPWYARPWSYRNFYNRPWYTLPYRYLYQSFGYNLPDPAVGNWPPVFVALDALPGYPFLDYDAPPTAWPGPCLIDGGAGEAANELEYLDDPTFLAEREMIEGAQSLNNTAIDDAELTGCYYW